MFVFLSKTTVCDNLHHSEACGQISVQMSSEALWAGLIVHEDYYILHEDSAVYNTFIWIHTWIWCVGPNPGNKMYLLDSKKHKQKYLLIKLYLSAYHIWSLIFFPFNSIVLILKSIPKMKIKETFMLHGKH